LRSILHSGGNPGRGSKGLWKAVPGEVGRLPRSNMGASITPEGH
jgi:hypothetical protein